MRTNELESIKKELKEMKEAIILLRGEIRNRTDKHNKLTPRQEELTNTIKNFYQNHEDMGGSKPLTIDAVVDQRQTSYTSTYRLLRELEEKGIIKLEMAPKGNRKIIKLL